VLSGVQSLDESYEEMVVATRRTARERAETKRSIREGARREVSTIGVAMKPLTAKLSTVALLAILLGLFATAIYARVIPGDWFYQDRYWAWLPWALASGVYVIALVARLLSGEKWT
jgi:hypothetical protein